MEKVAQSGENEFLTVREAARRLKIHPYTLKKWIHDGLINGYKLKPTAKTSMIRVRSADLMQLVERIKPQDQESIDNGHGYEPPAPQTGVKIVDNSVDNRG